MIVLGLAIWVWTSSTFSNQATSQIAVMAAEAEPLVWLLNLGTAGV